MAVPADDDLAPGLEDTGEFGLDGSNDDDWLGRLRDAEGPVGLGSVGRYSLIREVSRGGQGVVYQAREDDEGRKVALKRLLAGVFATEKDRRRFEREVEAASALEHPGIVSVFGIETIDGQPVIAMEWIDGRPINRLHLHRERDARNIIELTLEVCDAVRHAHQRGVIHRDLKPSNILVDADRHPHLVDFGLAKMGGGPSSLTLSAHFVGTPAYAAPEQFGAEPSADVRLDVYSMGVILFELLTGELPYSMPDNALEWLRTVQDVEPRRPSTVRPKLSRELDTILLKALEKDPDRRYQSVDALAEDLRRHLRGEPILAHPPSMGYQLRKLMRRHVWPFAFAGTLFVLSVLVAIWAWVQAGIIADERDAARNAEKIAQERYLEAEAARGEADAAKGMAEEEASRAEDEARRAAAEAERSASVVDFLMEDVLSVVDPSFDPNTLTLEAAMERAAAKLERVESPGARGQLHLTIGQTYLNFGRVDEAEYHVRTGIELFEDTFGSEDRHALFGRAALGAVLYRRGRFTEAVDHLREMLELFQQHIPDRLRYRAYASNYLGQALISLRRYDEAEELLAQIFDDYWVAYGADSAALQLLLSRVTALDALDRRDHSWQLLEGALDQIHERLGHSSLSSSFVEYAIALRHQGEGRFDEAEEFLVSCLESERELFSRRHPRVANVLLRLAGVRCELGRYDEAREGAQQAYLALRSNFGVDSGFVARAQQVQAWIEMRAGNKDRAAELFDEVLQSHPAVLASLVQNSKIAINEGRLTPDPRVTEESIYEFEMAVELAEGVRGRGVSMAWALHNLGAAHFVLYDLDGAREPFERALEVMEELDELHPSFHKTLTSLGAIYHNAGEQEASLALLERAEVMVLDAGGDPRTWSDVLIGQGMALMALERFDEALERHQEAFDLVRDWPPEHMVHIMASYSLGQCLSKMGRYADAEPYLEGAMEELVWRTDGNHPVVAQVRCALVELYQRWERPDDVERAQRIGID